ncbi:MAG TPA: hypothetical protein VFZ70_04900 [Euzebyales bacterium]
MDHDVVDRSSPPSGLDEHMRLPVPRGLEAVELGRRPAARNRTVAGDQHRAHRSRLDVATPSGKSDHAARDTVEHATFHASCDLVARQSQVQELADARMTMLAIHQLDRGGIGGVSAHVLRVVETAPRVCCVADLPVDVRRANHEVDDISRGYAGIGQPPTLVLDHPAKRRPPSEREGGRRFTRWGRVVEVGSVVGVVAGGWGWAGAGGSGRT